MLSTFFVLIGFLISFSESKSQTPRFHECDNLPQEELVCNPNSWYSVTDYITYTGGCVIEVDYIWKNCTINGTRHNKLEIVGWRLMNSPACNILYSQLMPGGVFNEIKARELQLFLNKKISDKLMQSLINSAGLSNLLPYYECDQFILPLNAVSFVQVFEGTCMAHCVTTGYDDVIITVPGDGGGNPAGLINPFQLPANGRYDWVNVTNKKCTETCCKIEIYYCYQSSTQQWIRRYLQTSLASDDCPNTVSQLELCVPPPYLLPRVTHITSQEFTQCTRTCEGQAHHDIIYFE